MKAVQVSNDQTVYIGTDEIPLMGLEDVLIDVYAAGVNRADTLQRVGKYPPPAGASDIMGLEVAGVISDLGRNVEGFKVGDKVMALLPGGGYAEQCVAHYGSVLPMPENLTFTEAAGIVEVFLTAYQAMFELGNLRKDETVLIHAGASGVGTAAIQLAKSVGAQVIITAGSDEKISFCKKLGADVGINYKSDPAFDRFILDYTGGAGANVIVDFVGGPYMERNINVAAVDGRIIMLAFMGGAKANEVNLVKVLVKRLSIQGSTLRARSNTYKSELVLGFKTDFWDEINSGEIKPVIDRVFTWDKVGEAHQYMKSNQNKGKIVLSVRQ